MPDSYRPNEPHFSGGPNRNRGGGDLSSWIPVLIFLVCFPPIGVLLAVHRLLVVIGAQRNRPGPRQMGAAPPPFRQTTQAPPFRQTAAPPPFHQTAAPQSPGAVWSVQDGGAAGASGAAPGSPAPRKLEDKTGRLLSIAGPIVAAIFGVGALGALLEGLAWGGLLSSLEEVFVPLAFCGGGLCMSWYGFRRRRQIKRYRQYLSLLGSRKSIRVSTLSEATGLSPKKVREDLMDMLDSGIFPMGYLDLGSDRLFLTDEGIQERPSQEAPPAPPKGMEREEAVLAEIRSLNDAIDDPEMSRKIDRIGEITGNIFACLREKPDKERQLRSFLSYYLPTTLKILRSYAQLEAQGVEGENISAAKARVEGMMDRVVEGFEQQLDRLFLDDAMDITSDVEVLERMLEKDGLGGGGLTLGG